MILKKIATKRNTNRRALLSSKEWKSMINP